MKKLFLSIFSLFLVTGACSLYSYDDQNNITYNYASGPSTDPIPVSSLPFIEAVNKNPKLWDNTRRLQNKELYQLVNENIPQNIPCILNFLPGCSYEDIITTQQPFEFYILPVTCDILQPFFLFENVFFIADNQNLFKQKDGKIFTFGVIRFVPKGNEKVFDLPTLFVIQPDEEIDSEFIYPGDFSYDFFSLAFLMQILGLDTPNIEGEEKIEKIFKFLQENEESLIKDSKDFVDSLACYIHFYGNLDIIPLIKGLKEADNIFQERQISHEKGIRENIREWAKTQDGQIRLQEYAEEAFQQLKTSIYTISNVNQKLWEIIIIVTKNPIGIYTIKYVLGQISQRESMQNMEALFNNLLYFVTEQIL